MTNTIAYTSSPSTIKTLILAMKTVDPANIYTACFCETATGGILGFKNNYFARSVGKLVSTTAGTVTSMLDGQILVLDQSPSPAINPNDGAYHTFQFTNLDLSTWGDLTVGGMLKTTSAIYGNQSGTSVALIAAYNSNHSNSLLQADYTALTPLVTARSTQPHWRIGLQVSTGTCRQLIVGSC